MNSSLPTPQGQFGAPLGGVTALDLLESFGFEGGLEAVTHEPSSPTSPTLSEFPFRCKLFWLDRSFVQIIELHFLCSWKPWSCSAWSESTDKPQVANKQEYVAGLQCSEYHKP